ncbi:MAG TPA: E2/UBC family protein [Chloroflexota bacterium]|nr:E2/UBC family protein [Chloroflexota bacterium]
MLLPKDQEFVSRKGFATEVSSENGMVCLVIKDFRLPDGYAPQKTDLLIRIPPGYPDMPPDMFWCDPPVRLSATGGFPQAADLMETYLGRTWQRFSRHLSPAIWRSGVDGLESYFCLISQALRSSVGT